MRKVLCLFSAVLFITQSAQASLTISSTVVQSDLDGMINPSINITGASPWDFTGQDYDQLISIDEIIVILTFLDGDTEPNGYDENQLVLGLDGHDTGLLLNGFTNDLYVTQLINGVNGSLDVLADLQSDGQLIGSIIDLSPNDNYINLNANTTTLVLKGQTAPIVPVPTALFLGSLGVTTLVWFRKYRVI